MGLVALTLQVLFCTQTGLQELEGENLCSVSWEKLLREAGGALQNHAASSVAAHGAGDFPSRSVSPTPHSHLEALGTTHSAER